MWYLKVGREIERGYGSCTALGPLPLGAGATGAVYTGGRAQGHRVGLANQMRQVGKCLRGRAVQQRPVVAKGARGGRGHQSRGPGGQGRGGGVAGGFSQQHLEDVVDNITSS